MFKSSRRTLPGLFPWEKKLPGENCTEVQGEKQRACSADVGLPGIPRAGIPMSFAGSFFCPETVDKSKGASQHSSACCLRRPCPWRTPAQNPPLLLVKLWQRKSWASLLSYQEAMLPRTKWYSLGRGRGLPHKRRGPKGCHIRQVVWVCGCPMHRGLHPECSVPYSSPAAAQQGPECCTLCWGGGGAGAGAGATQAWGSKSAGSGLAWVAPLKNAETEHVP